MLGQRGDEGGIAGGRRRSVDASTGGGQDASWSAMVKMGGWRITGGAEASLLKILVLTKPVTLFVRALWRVLLWPRVSEKNGDTKQNDHTLANPVKVRC